MGCLFIGFAGASKASREQTGDVYDADTAPVCNALRAVQPVATLRESLFEVDRAISMTDCSHA